MRRNHTKHGKKSKPAIRYCKLCGAGPREWMGCEVPDCNIETQEEAETREGGGCE